MRVTGLAATGLAFAWIAVPSLLAGDAPTSARATAEVGFAAIRKAAVDKDDATLGACLPAALVAKWPDEAKDDAKKWRADLAALLGAGEVVWVHESGDAAIARWKAGTPPVVREMRLAFAGGRWVAASPWAYCVGGGALAKANGKGAAHVKLKARHDPDAYGSSAFSFVHVTQDAKQCNGRVDCWYCGVCGQWHFMGAMVSRLTATKLDDLDGLQAGGDWMDEIAPKPGVYALALKEGGRKDFQVVLAITACTADALEFDWRLVAAGRNAPANIHAPQPYKGDVGADGVAGLCGKPGK